jgi:hypothetical protein
MQSIGQAFDSSITLLETSGFSILGDERHQNAEIKQLWLLMHAPVDRTEYIPH